MIEAYRRGGGEGKPHYFQCHLSFAATEAEALASAYDQWRFSALPGIVTEHRSTLAQFDAATIHVRPEDFAEHVRSSADLECQIDWLHSDLEIGFSHLYPHDVGRYQLEFIKAFGQRALPALA